VLTITDGWIFLNRVIVIVAILMVVTACARGITCVTPVYDKGAVFVDTSESLIMNLSVKEEDVAPEALRCLVKAIKAEYKGRTEVGLFIYDSAKVAKAYLPVMAYQEVADGLGNKREDARSLRASYEYGHGDEHLTILPLGLSANNSFDARIDLLDGGAAKCKIQAGQRCLVKLEEPGFFKEIHKKDFGVSIVLGGTVFPDGSVRDVRVIEEKRDASKMTKIERYLCRNLRTWRFVRSGGKNEVRITYRFVLDRTMGEGREEVEVVSPGEIVIKGNPRG
jgi:hypothetical protein